MAKSTSEYTITLGIGTDFYQGTGKTALEALTSLPKPTKMMNKGVLTISDGTKTKTLLFYPARLKRLFYNEKFQEIQVKWLAACLK